MHEALTRALLTLVRTQHHTYAWSTYKCIIDTSTHSA